MVVRLASPPSPRNPADTAAMAAPGSNRPVTGIFQPDASYALKKVAVDDPGMTHSASGEPAFSLSSKGDTSVVSLVRISWAVTVIPAAGASLAIAAAFA